jgi:hypothetical protein
MRDYSIEKCVGAVLCIEEYGQWTLFEEFE